MYSRTVPPLPVKAMIEMKAMIENGRSIFTANSEASKRLKTKRWEISNPTKCPEIQFVRPEPDTNVGSETLSPAQFSIFDFNQGWCEVQ